MMNEAMKSFDELSFDTLSSSEQRVAEVKALYQNHHQNLMQRVMAKGLGKREAEEVVQEAFVRLLGLDNKDISNYIQAYLYRIAFNLAIDKMRHNARSPEDEGIEQELFYNDVTSPERKNESLQLLEKMTLSIKSLPLKCRQAFILYKIKGLSYTEIATQMNISESMVRKYVLRAVRHCFDELQSDL
ncbi:RNA polymerase sigma factor [Colwellia asteriadis]